MKTTILTTAFILCLVLEPYADFTGKVVSIEDGDTITVLTEENNRVKVRLKGVDAPEINKNMERRQNNLPMKNALERS